MQPVQLNIFWESFENQDKLVLQGKRQKTKPFPEELPLHRQLNIAQGTSYTHQCVPEIDFWDFKPKIYTCFLV